MRITLDEPLLTDGQRHVLKSLGSVASMFGLGYGLEGPESKHWRRDADELVRKGFAEEVEGYYAITNAGRDALQSNHQ